MQIVLRNAAGQPIYEQIYHQIKQAILTEDLQAGELLPSIRTLAKDLRVSVITTKRAYDELQKDGYIDAVASRGFYVAENNTERIREAHIQQIEGYLQKAIALAPACGLSDTELADMLRALQQEA